MAAAERRQTFHDARVESPMLHAMSLRGCVVLGNRRAFLPLTPQLEERDIIEAPLL
jgi:hypothetical protein